ncbi:N-6 DNA methylase [Actinomyces sp. SKVG-SVH-4(1)]|uniref:N-6 DNA methylase n=1 Tax=Actinomyces sp. SKVG-SVH-4(1) TaxID=3240382 RepID=UPI003AF1F8C4
MTSFSARDTLISRLVKRDPARTEADIQSDIHALLVVGELMNIGDQQARMESPSADGTRRRIDVEVGQLAIEVKKDLRNQTVRVDGEAQLEGYIKTRTEQSGAHYSGVLTDGVLWLLFNVGAEGRRLVAELDMTGKKTHVLVRWLEAVLSTQTQVKPTPAEIVRRLGASSPAHLVDVAAFRDLYQANANNSEVALKRELWAKLLRTAFGSAFEDDETLFINHTLLVLTAEIIAHAALGFDVSATGGIGAKKLSLGTEFSNSQIVGVVQPDFFDWPLDVDGGEELIANVARRISQFNWEHVEHDVLKLLYESVIDTRDRKALGEYYTPDWLAQSIVDANVDEPLTQRVADVACGSGTFLFHAIRRYLAAADRAAMSNGDAISGLTSHVTGMDVHPVAVTIARVTYLLAIGAERLKADDRGPIAVPVYLGDSLQWEQQADIFTSEEQLTIATSGADLVGAGAALFHENLVFPKSVLHDAANFDRLVTAMSDKASDTSNRKSKTVISPTLRQFGIPEHDMDVLVNTYDTMRRLHADGRDGIWGYYVRNLVRPTWLSADDNKVDVLVGNPPWLRYGAMTGPMQKRFTSMLKAHGLITGRAGVTGRDLAPLFVVRTTALYLRAGGRFAMIVPHGVLTRQPHAEFRSGRWGSTTLDLRVQFDRAWDLREAATGFPNHAAVIIGNRSTTSKAMTTEVETWSTKGIKSNVTWDEILPRLTRNVTTVGVTREKDAAVTFSVYRKRFRQGAVLAPRMLTFVEKGKSSPLGAGAGRVPVVSRKTNQDKQPWKALPPISEVVEKAFIRRVHLGETILPFRTAEPLKAVLPISPKTGKLLSPSEIAEHEGLSNWWGTAENFWSANKSAKASETFLDRIDYIHQLSAQLPSASQRVVYTKAGNTITAARVDDVDAIIDHKLYWAATNTVDESRYLVGILNSAAVLERVKPFMAVGLFGPRDVDKNVFRALIQPYDASNQSHIALTEAVAEAEDAASKVNVSETKTFKEARKLIRAELEHKALLPKIEALVLDVVPTVAP